MSTEWKHQPSECNYEMDPSRKIKQRATQGDMDEISGKRDERPWLDLGSDKTNGNKQTELAILG